MCCSSRRRAPLTEMRGIATRFGDRVPLLANMVEGGATPMQSAQRPAGDGVFAS